MKQLLIALLALPCTCHAQLIPAKTIYIDMSTSPSPDELNKRGNRYFVVFGFHDAEWDKNPDVKSVAGHAWVMWGTEDLLAGKSTIEAYGFYPNRDLAINTFPNSSHIGSFVASPYKFAYPLFDRAIRYGRNHQIDLAGLKIIAGATTGVIKDDISAARTFNTVHQIVLKVDYKQYLASKNVLRDFKQNPPNYSLVRQDCVEFLISVGDAMGFDMPNRSWTDFKSWFPSHYLHLFINSLRTPNAMSMFDGEETVSGDNDGNYMSRDNTRKAFTGRNGVIGSDGSFSDGAVDDGSVVHSSTRFKSGDVWRLSFIKGREFSQLTFANGNSLSTYDGSNRSSGIMRLANGDAYQGGIDNLGNPDGTGEYFVTNKADEVQVVSYYKGVFAKGKLVSYLPVSTNQGQWYGATSGNQCIGPGKFVGNDGTVCYGTFVNGFINGNAEYKFPDGTSMKAKFVNGIASGNGTWNASNGTYVGNFEAGRPHGQGVFTTKNGYVFNCSYSNGVPVSGRCTFPNGSYFVGTFTANGLGNGTLYHSDGTPINDSSSSESTSGSIEFPRFERPQTEKKTDGLIMGPVLEVSPVKN